MADSYDRYMIRIEEMRQSIKNSIRSIRKYTNEM